MKKELLRMENIVKTFPGVRALNNAAITVHEGEVMGLMGENGAGKSTLMNVLGGVFTADSRQHHILQYQTYWTLRTLVHSPAQPYR